MQISYKWLQSYFKDKLPDPGELAKLINLRAFEVEGVHDLLDDYLLDLDVLSNRAHDALSHTGVAREIAVILDKPVTEPVVEYKTSDVRTGDYVDVKIEDSMLVPRVVKLIAADLKVGPSPDYIVERLKTLGQRSINNVVDITNYVMFETGQPVHAFDYDKLAGRGVKEMMCRRARDGEEITMLDGKEFALDKDTLVWADSEKALDIAGIKGGINSGVDEGTKTIVLSSCNFQSTNIRKTRTRLNIITEASKRFEHEISPELAPYAMRRLAVLLSEHAGAKIAGDWIDQYPTKSKRKEVTMSIKRVNEFLGTSVDDSEFEKIMQRFTKYAGFGMSKKGGSYTVLAPYERLDISIEEDVIEEFARIYGYENIVSVKPEGTSHTVNREYYFMALLRNHLRDLGWSEVYNYSFSQDGAVEIINPIGDDRRRIRTSLEVGLFDNLLLNTRNAPLLGLDKVKIFEFGRVFESVDKEYWSLGLALENLPGAKNGSVMQEIRDVMSGIEKILGAKIVWDIKEGARGGVIALTNFAEVIKNIQTPTDYGDLLDSEIVTEYKPFSAYPFVLRDIAVWVPGSTSADQVLDLINKEASEWLVQSRLFDQFEKGGRTSYAYRLVFQSMERTLTDAEVNEVMGRIAAKLNSQPGFEVR